MKYTAEVMSKRKEARIIIMELLLDAVSVAHLEKAPEYIYKNVLPAISKYEDMLPKRIYNRTYSFTVGLAQYIADGYLDILNWPKFYDNYDVKNRTISDKTAQQCIINVYRGLSANLTRTVKEFGEKTLHVRLKVVSLD